MSDTKKSIKIEATPVYDTELLFSRIIGLQQSRELGTRDILAYELSAIPSALFDEYGNMRSSSKAILKNKLHIEMSKRSINTYDAVIIDGCALLWNIHWPATGTVEQYIKNLITRPNDYI